MSDYEPNVGDMVLVTLRVTYMGGYYDFPADGRPSVTFGEDAEAIVSVEPPPIQLPTLPGAVIRGTVRSGAVKILWHPNMRDLWIAEDGDEWETTEITRVVEVLFPGVES